MIKNYLKFSIECEYKENNTHSTINIRNLNFADLSKISKDISPNGLELIKLNYTTIDLVEYIWQELYSNVNQDLYSETKKLINHFCSIFNNKKYKTEEQAKKEAYDNIPKEYKQKWDSYVLLVGNFIEYWLPCLKIAQQIQLTGTIEIIFNSKSSETINDKLVSSIDKLAENLKPIIKSQINIFNQK